MRVISEQELKDILAKHKDYLAGKAGGVRANLSGANLYGANLYGASLSGANLYGANLYGANLSNTSLQGKTIVSFLAGRHTAYYFGQDEIKIGCHAHSLNYWLQNFEQIGTDNQYTGEQIKKYGRFIKSCVADYKRQQKESK